MSTQLAAIGDAYTDPTAFEHLQRVAKPFASSEMVPSHIRGNISNVIVALLIAREMNESPITVMQSIYFVNGRPGFSASYIIARANRSGVFRGRITWDVTGEGKSLAVTAKATLADAGDLVSYTVTMAMAEAEGWTKNPKYRSMPELMLRYRSATALVRLYAPEVLLGYRAVEEIEVEAPATAVSSTTKPASLGAALGLADPPVLDATEVPAAAPTEPERAPEPVTSVGAEE